MNAEVVLDILTRHAPKRLNERFISAHCIGATRVVIDVLRRLDVPCHPQAFAVEILNEAAVRAVEGGYLADKRRTFAEGAKIIGVDGSGSIVNGEWDGHLAAVIDVEVPIVVDLAAGQFARPTRGIELGPFWTTVPSWPLQLRDERGGFMQYRPTNVRSFRNSPNWTNRRHTADIVEEVLAEIAQVSSRLDDVTAPE